jgi:predicted TIM-barrel fold metal-dependent hydrolase
VAYEIKRFPYDGTIDADGHILEPADLWENYLERKFVDRALRIKVDDEGFEYLEIDQKPSQRSKKGSLGLLGAMGHDDMRPSPDRRYADNMPFGSSDAKERIDLLAQENLECALLYPTIGLLWEVELKDRELSLAYCTAYNRWIADFCRDSGGKLIPIAQLTLLDVEGSTTELERAVKDGCKGAWINPFNHLHTIHGDEKHDPLYAKCVELDVPIAIHPTFTPHKAADGIFDLPRQGRGLAEIIWLRSIVQQALISFFSLGTLERFPQLRLGILEAGSGWIGALLDRLEAFSESLNMGRASARELFGRQCFISGDPDETAAPHIVSHVGEDCFMWATDYPHPDHPHTWVDDLERYANILPPSARVKVLGDNVRRIYKI